MILLYKTNIINTASGYLVIFRTLHEKSCINDLRKRDKMRVFSELNKFSNPRAQMFDFVYHITLNVFKKYIKFCARVLINLLIELRKRDNIRGIKTVQPLVAFHLGPHLSILCHFQDSCHEKVLLFFPETIIAYINRVILTFNYQCHAL